MATSVIITVTFLTFITIVQSALPTKTLPAYHLNVIYNDCQGATPDKFCLGGRDSTEAFPEGTFCLRQRNCQALLTGHRVGNTIEWTLLMALDGETASVFFEVKPILDTSSNGYLNVFLFNGGFVAVTAADKQQKTIPINWTNDKDVYKIKETAIIESSSTSPRMLMARLTSPTVIRFDPISLKVDTGFYCDTFLYRKPTSGDLTRYSATTTKIFGRVASVATTDVGLPSKTLEPKHLQNIYDGCQVTTSDRICLGGSGSVNAFPEGTNCLKQRDCQALVTGHRTGTTVEWTLLMALDGDTDNVVFEVAPVLETSSKGHLQVFMSKDGFLVTMEASDKQWNKVPITWTNDKNIYKIKETAIIESSSKSPRMFLARLTSPTVISFDPISLKVDTGFYCNTFLYRKPKSSKLIEYSAKIEKIFGRGVTITTTPPPTIVVEVGLPTMTLEPKHLQNIYDGCQVTTFDHFCMGGQGFSLVAFPEGTGCLKGRDCQSLLIGHRNGWKIEWTILMALDADTDYVFFYLQSGYSSGYLEVKLESEGHKVIVQALDKSVRPITIDSTNDKNVFKFVEAAVIKKKDATSPQMLMARLVSTASVRFDPISLNVDTSKPFDTHLIRSIKYSSKVQLTSAHNQKMFDRGTKATTTTTKKAKITTPTKKKPKVTTTKKSKVTKPTKTPKTIKPKDKSKTRFPGRPTSENSSSHLASGQTVGIITLMAIAVLVHMYMQ